jgi:hypothetical protein
MKIDLDLTDKDVQNLRDTHEFVRVHFAHTHTFDERDTVLATLSNLYASIERAIKEDEECAAWRNWTSASRPVKGGTP